MKNKLEYSAKLGLFITIGLALFVITIYLIGKQKNMFGSNLHLKTSFKTVSGLKIGNNVRFSGINIGTVTDIEMINDTSVVVYLLVKKEIGLLIKTDSKASISSDGLIGDKVLSLSSGLSKNSVKNNSYLGSINAIEMDDIMKSMKKTMDNASIISNELALFTMKMNDENGFLSQLMSNESFSDKLRGTMSNLLASSNEFADFTGKMNNGNGTLSKLMNDEKFSKMLDSTMYNLQKGTKGLSENMEAAKSSIFLKGYYNKKRDSELKLLEQKKEAVHLKSLLNLGAIDSTKVDTLKL
jgi:phospholipid/cholesterol/gamma-HCH transport system substrate-binding protein